MAMVTLQTEAEMKAAQAAAAAGEKGEKKDPLAGINVLTAQGQEPGQKGIQITEKALKRDSRCDGEGRCFSAGAGRVAGGDSGWGLLGP